MYLYLTKQLEFLILKYVDEKRSVVNIKELREVFKENFSLIKEDVPDILLLKLALASLQRSLALDCTTDEENWFICPRSNAQAELAIKTNLMASIFDMSIFEDKHDDKNYTRNTILKKVFSKTKDNDKVYTDCILLEEDFQYIAWKLKMYGMSFLYSKKVVSR